MINRVSEKYVRLTVLVLVISCCFTYTDSMAQRDMIRTQAGEEIRCRIIDETPVRVVFAYLKNGKPYRSEIFKNLVTSFKFNFYATDLPNANKLPEAMYRATDNVGSQSSQASSAAVDNKDKITRREKRREKRVKQSKEEESSEIVEQKEKENTEVAQKLVKPGVGTVQEVDLNSTEPKVEADFTQEGQGTVKKTNSAVVEKGGLVKKVDVLDKVTSAAEGVKDNSTNDSDTQVAPKGGSRTTNSVVKDKTDAENKTTNSSEAGLPNAAINQENKFRIGIKGGVGNRLDNNLQTINSYDLYLEQLLRGWTLGADIAYFPTNSLGFGVVFTDFRSRNKDNEILYRNEFTGAEQIGSIANNRSVKFVGPALFLRKKLDYKTYVVLGLSPGYNFYQDRGSYDGVDYTFSGGGFGGASTLGIDFLLGNDIGSRDLILSFEAGYNYGKIDALDYGDARGLVDLATPIDISRLDFTVGLRFIRFPKRKRD